MTLDKAIHRLIVETLQYFLAKENGFDLGQPLENLEKRYHETEQILDSSNRLSEQSAPKETCLEETLVEMYWQDQLDRLEGNKHGCYD